MSHAHTIEKIIAREILDSRGIPTVSATVYLASGLQASADVPSGTSTGSHEAHELRDGDKDRYKGLGVLQAVANVNEKINKALKGLDVSKQQEIDEEMKQLDGTVNLKKLGANAVLAVSLAVARVTALSQSKPLYEYLSDLLKLPVTGYRLPVPLFNIFNGGKHADTNLDFQEFMVIPGGVDRNFAEQLRAGAEIFHTLKEVLLDANFDTDVGLEGGYAPNLDNSEQALDMILAAIAKAGYKAGSEIQLGVDVGASVLYDSDRKFYHFGLLDHDMMPAQLVSLYNDWTKKYPFIYIEDGLHEDDWFGWRDFTNQFKQVSQDITQPETGQEFLIAGDDIFVTNTQRLQAGIEQQVANCVLVKPNQVGTLSQTLEFIRLAKDNGYKVIISHRSGDTSDSFIADLAVGVGADYIKTGSLSRGERTAKYNRLLEIEKELYSGNE
jgi:enolase